MDRPTEPERHRRLPAPPGRRFRAGAYEPTPDEAPADEAAADETRRRLREQGIVPIEPDERIGVLLTPEECVVAVRRAVVMERRKGWQDPQGGLAGDLYVTTRRLVHLGRLPVEYPLAEIREAVVAAGALRLVVGACHGVEIAVRDPRVLRVQIAAAREAFGTAAAGDGSLPGVRGGHAAGSRAPASTSNDDQASLR